MSIEGFTLLPMSTTMSVLTVYKKPKKKNPNKVSISDNDSVPMFRVKMKDAELKRFSSDPVVSCEAVHLHLTATHCKCEVSVSLPLHLAPVHVKVWTSEDTQEAVTLTC